MREVELLLLLHPRAAATLIQSGISVIQSRAGALMRLRKTFAVLKYFLQNYFPFFSFFLSFFLFVPLSLFSLTKGKEKVGAVG